jgi:hypothetical protein
MQVYSDTETARLDLAKLARVERIASRRFERILTADGAVSPLGAVAAGAGIDGCWFATPAPRASRTR